MPPFRVRLATQVQNRPSAALWEAHSGIGVGEMA